jgi:hypothetical protein
LTMFYVTDHALLRYMERVIGIDLAQIRTQMVQEAQAGEIINDYGKNGESGIRHEKAVFIISGRNHILTVMEFDKRRAVAIQSRQLLGPKPVPNQDDRTSGHKRRLRG